MKVKYVCLGLSGNFFEFEIDYHFRWWGKYCRWATMIGVALGKVPFCIAEEVP